MANPFPYTANVKLPASDLNEGIIHGHYSRVVPTTGSTVTLSSAMASTDWILALDPAGSLAALTLTMPSGVNKRRIRIATRQRIDTLTINGSGGDSVDWAANELPQNGVIELLYVSAITTWVLI